MLKKLNRKEAVVLHRLSEKDFRIILLTSPEVSQVSDAPFPGLFILFQFNFSCFPNIVFPC